jgi:hypothetical protein
MASNYVHEFSPNTIFGEEALPVIGVVQGQLQAICPLDPNANDNACPVIYGAKFCMFAGDSGSELKVHLRTVRCKEGHSEEDPSTWEPLNINGYKFITLYLRDTQTKEHFMTIHGYPVSPMREGNVVFRMPEHVFDCASGEYEGEVEVEYWTGRIVTAIEKVLLEVREDFSGHGEANTHPKCQNFIEHLPAPIEDPVPTQLPWFDETPQIEHRDARRLSLLQSGTATMAFSTSALIARAARVKPVRITR